MVERFFKESETIHTANKAECRVVPIRLAHRRIEGHLCRGYVQGQTGMEHQV